MASQPEKILAAIRRYVLDPRPENLGTWAAPGGHQGSTNLRMIRILGDAVGGEKPAIEEMAAFLDRQIRSGLMADELGSGYAGVHIHCGMLTWRWCRDGGSERSPLGGVVESWLGLVLRCYLAHSVSHRDSAIAATAGVRKRSPTVTAADLLVQAALGEPPRKYGLSEDDPQDDAEYYWRGANPQESRWMEDTLGLPLPEWVESLGIDRGLARQVLDGSAAAAEALTRGVRTRWPTVLARYPDGSLASYIESCTAHDAPQPGVVAGRTRIEVLRLAPGGPRATPKLDADGRVVRERDHQWWGGENLQRARVEGDELHGELWGRQGLERSGDEGQRLEKQTPSLALPAGDPAFIVRFSADRDPERLDRRPGRKVPTTTPDPSTGTTVTDEPPTEPAAALLQQRRQLGRDFATVFGDFHRGQRPVDNVLGWISSHCRVAEEEVRRHFDRAP